MHSLASHREVSKRRKCRFARGTKVSPPRAVRPLAASAALLVRGALVSRISSGAVVSVGKPCLFKESMALVSGGCLLCNFWPAKVRSARPGCSGSAATSFAPGGGLGSFSSGATRRTMRAGSMPPGALPNPSINRTANGGSRLLALASAQPPLSAGYLKR